MISVNLGSQRYFNSIHEIRSIIGQRFVPKPRRNSYLIGWSGVGFVVIYENNFFGKEKEICLRS